jgi:starch synthase
MPGCGVGFDFFTPDALEFYGNFSFIKSGILYSDAVTTVSKGYAREILTEEFGCGLDGLLRSRQNALYGILNGADYNLWNPETDKHIIKGYTTEDPSGKKACKKDLLKSMGLPDDLSQPVLGVVSRLATQKGLDIIISAANELISMNTKLVVLGSGDDSYQSQLKNLAAAHPNNIAVRIGFDNALAHKIEAGCDMFLMPSRYEPCGLNQIYSLKYGTIPVVRATGGLDDTITDYSMDRKKGNGFKFPAATKDDFLNALNRALEVYRKKEEWSTLMKTGMEMDFSWAKSAKEYIKLYKKLLTEKK